MASVQPTPEQILQDIHERATRAGNTLIIDAGIRERVEYLCRCSSNRAGVRLLMSCLLGKLHNPEVARYAARFYEETGGTEIALLDWEVG